MNCIIHDFGYRGIVAVGVPSTYPNWILNNEIYNCEDAVYPNNAESWDIIGNYLHDMVDTPLEIGGNANFSRVMFNRIKTTGTGGGGTDHGIEVKGYTHDFIILGNIIQDTIGTAIDIAQASYGVVVGNKIYNSKTHGISVSTGSYDIAVTGNVVVGTSTSQRGIRVTGSSRISVLNNVVVNCPSNGIDITDASSDIIVSGNIAKGNYYGVRVYNSNRVTVTSNYCSNSASDGISPGGTSADLLIENNFCYNNSAYGIDIEAGPTNTVVKHNYLLGNTAGSLRNAGTGSVIKNNIGYVTENGGVATFSGDGSTKTFTIAHGLASTPTKVLVTAGSDAAKGDFYVTADATNITVTYATAPPSGTNNVVLNWYAEV
jgi:parallel beta-helix repeat protein